MIRRTKKQVKLELPPKQRIVVPLPVEMNKYKKEEIDLYNAYPKTKLESNTVINRLNFEAAYYKLKSVIEWIDNFFEETDEKLVVFAYHHIILDLIKDNFAKKIYKNSSVQDLTKNAAKRLRGESTSFAVKIDGSTLSGRRKKYVHQFNTNHDTRLLVGQIQAAGTAISLVSASTIVFAEMTFVPGEMLQAEDRIHRIGQEKPVQIYYLVGKDTVEHDLCRILQRKFKTITTVLDGKLPLHEPLEYNIYEKLMKEVQRRNKL